MNSRLELLHAGQGDWPWRSIKRGVEFPEWPFTDGFSQALVCEFEIMCDTLALPVVERLCEHYGDSKVYWSIYQPGMLPPDDGPMWDTFCMDVEGIAETFDSVQVHDLWGASVAILQNRGSLAGDSGGWAWFASREYELGLIVLKGDGIGLEDFVMPVWPPEAILENERLGWFPGREDERRQLVELARAQCPESPTEARWDRPTAFWVWLEGCFLEIWRDTRGQGWTAQQVMAEALRRPFPEKGPFSVPNMTHRDLGLPVFKTNQD